MHQHVLISRAALLVGLALPAAVFAQTTVHVHHHVHGFRPLAANVIIPQRSVIVPRSTRHARLGADRAG